MVFSVWSDIETIFQLPPYNTVNTNMKHYTEKQDNIYNYFIQKVLPRLHFLSLLVYSVAYMVATHYIPFPSSLRFRYSASSLLLYKY